MRQFLVALEWAEGITHVYSTTETPPWLSLQLAKLSRLTNLVLNCDLPASVS